MTILHIANSYGGTAVYTNLYTAIDENADVTQWVYVPLNSRNHDRVGNKMIDFRSGESRIQYSTLLKPYHKFLYGLKIHTIVRDVVRYFDMTKVDVIHAGTLCLDGAVAYEPSEPFGSRYPAMFNVGSSLSYNARLLPLIVTMLAAWHYGLGLSDYIAYCSVLALATEAIAKFELITKDVALLGPELKLCEPILQAESEAKSGA